MLREGWETFEFHFKGMRQDGACPHPALRATLSQRERVWLLKRQADAMSNNKPRKS